MNKQESKFFIIMLMAGFTICCWFLILIHNDNMDLKKEIKEYKKHELLPKQIPACCDSIKRSSTGV